MKCLYNRIGHKTYLHEQKTGSKKPMIQIELIRFEAKSRQAQQAYPKFM